MNFFRSLQFRLLLLLIVVASVPIGVVSLINLNTASRLVEEEVEARQIEVSQIISEQVSIFIDDIVGKLQTLGRGSVALRLEREALNIYAASYLEPSENGDSIYRSIWLMDAEGNELGGIVAGNPIAYGNLANRHEDEIFFRPERGEIYFSNVRVINGSPQISMSVPILDESGAFVGVVGAVIDLQGTWDVIRDLQLGTSGYAMLLDRRGNIMVHRDEAVIAARYNLADAPPFAAALRGENLAVYQYGSPIADSVVGTGVTIAGPNWVLLVERPTSEAFATISQASRNILLGFIVAIFVSAGISLLLARQISRPIVDLRDVVQRFGAGHLGVRSKLTSKDEIGQLAVGFNAMAERLKTRINEIDLKNTELQLANEKVLEASRLKDEFLAVMSHELRTPLNAIIGFSGILLMDEELTEKQAFQVQRIETNSERLLRLINDILDISRIQAGRMTFNHTPLDIRRAVKRLHEQLDVLAKNKNLEFSYEIAEDLPKMVTVDEDALTKIITNLSSNGIKFTNRGAVTIELLREGGNLLIRVNDTGVGIPPQMHEVIFEEFRQVDSSSMRSYGGTGLGLAIVRRLSMAMGGGVSVRSKVNEGSSFTVSLPLLKTEEIELVGEAHV